MKMSLEISTRFKEMLRQICMKTWQKISLRRNHPNKLTLTMKTSLEIFYRFLKYNEKIMLQLEFNLKLIKSFFIKKKLLAHPICKHKISLLNVCQVKLKRIIFKTTNLFRDSFSRFNDERVSF